MKTKKNPKLEIPTVRKLYFKPSYIAIAVVVLLLTLFFARVAIWEHSYIAAKEGSERSTVAGDDQVEGEGVYDGGEEVDTSDPTAGGTTEYFVSGNRPRYFSIPSLGINNARIVELGRKASGEMETPRNIYDVGWYSASSLPGTNGTSVLDAHGGSLGNGIFRSLPKIHQNDTVRIEMGDGRVYNYRVVDIVTKPLGPEANAYMNDAFESPVPGTGSITLITCTGDWWQASQTYSHRMFVRAVIQQ